MRGLDPAVRAEQVLPRVYNPETNERLVRRLRVGRSYGKCITVDVVGCNMRCSYCYVAGSLLDGKDSRNDRIFGKESKKGLIKSFSPIALLDEVEKFYYNGHRSLKNIQITAGEPFMTPRWLLAVVSMLAQRARQRGGKIWIDTNGFDLLHNSEMWAAESVHPLTDYMETVRLFISSKNSPRLYTATTRVDEKYSNTGFRALEICWKRGISAFLQGPIALFYQPEDFEWFYNRLTRIHPVAPLLLDLDRISLLPFKRIIGGMKQTGLWDLRQKQPIIEKLWQEFLEKKYGRKLQRLISVDYHVKDEELVSRFIFNEEPIENFPLFI